MGRRVAPPIGIIKAGKTLARRYAVLTTFMAYVTLPAHKINVPPPAPRYNTVFPRLIAPNVCTHAIRLLPSMLSQMLMYLNIEKVLTGPRVCAFPIKVGFTRNFFES